MLVIQTKSRIGFLALCCWLGLTGVSYGVGPATDPKVLHVLNRLGYGPRPGDVERVSAQGVKAYIRDQLQPAAIAEPPELTQQLQTLKTLAMTPGELFQNYGPQRGQKRQAQAASSQQTPAQAQSPKPKLAQRQQLNKTVEEATTARLARALYSRRQLQEVMVDFWFNHFNVFAPKGLTRLWVGAYEQEAIRPHALGNFRQLLGATARHPAMLVYLDNWRNTAPNSPKASKRFQGLNENYARELMELHTLGVKGGYTQEDVITLAKIFTGWGLCSAGLPDRNSSGFCFDPDRHDASDKVFLGQRIPGQGMAEGEQALDILASSPATARHISQELAAYFVADQPPATLVDRLTQRFLSTKGDIRAVLQTLFESPEFWSPQIYNAKFKTPYRYVISSVRATGLPLTQLKPMARVLTQLGMPLYNYQAPDGYPQTEEFWLNSEALNRRVNFALALASGRLPAQQQSYPPVDAIALNKTLGYALSPQTQKAIAASSPAMRSALILGSPDFMRY